MSSLFRLANALPTALISVNEPLLLTASLNAWLADLLALVTLFAVLLLLATSADVELTALFAAFIPLVLADLLVLSSVLVDSLASLLVLADC